MNLDSLIQLAISLAKLQALVLWLVVSAFFTLAVILACVSEALYWITGWRTKR